MATAQIRRCDRGHPAGHTKTRLEVLGEDSDREEVMRASKGLQEPVVPSLIALGHTTRRRGRNRIAQLAAPRACCVDADTIGSIANALGADSSAVSKGIGALGAPPCGGR